MPPTDLNTTRRTVTFDRNRLTLEDIVDIARGRAKAELSADPALRAAITRGVMAARLASLAKGFSGVSLGLLEQIARLLDAGLLQPRAALQCTTGWPQVAMRNSWLGWLAARPAADRLRDYYWFWSASEARFKL